MDSVNLNNIGKILIFIGVGITILGGLLLLFSKLPFLGRLPGDIVIKREDFSLYFPVATSIILSIVLTIVINIVIRIFMRK